MRSTEICGETDVPAERSQRTSMGSIRVLHCPEVVGGHAQGLASAERKLGLRSWSVGIYRGDFGYQADEVLWADRSNPLKREIKRWPLLFRALMDFDIIHFNFGQSIAPQWVSPSATAPRTYHPLIRSLYGHYSRLFELCDLPLLKRAGKGIVVTYQGDDGRQGDFCLASFEISPASEVEPGYYSAESDAHKRKRISKFAQYADRIYALNPDLLHMLPAGSQFLPYSHVDPRDWQGADEGDRDPTVPVILHAPSHRGVKGTAYVLEAISRLRREGVALEFLLLEGLPRTEARPIYGRVDLLIDQLLCGWYGGLAVELMALGKPVVCYIREEDLKFIPSEMRQDLPIIHASPATLHQVLREWLTERRHELREMGRRSRAYVEKWHDPLKIAARMRGEYEAIMASKQRKVRR